MLHDEAAAWPQHRHGPRRPTPALQEYLQLPYGYNPRTRAWAAELRSQPRLAQADPRTLVNAVLEHLRTHEYLYTLEPGTYGRDAVDEFWFDRKLGFCEHFAASVTVVLRAMDVPARVVTGYQGTDPLPVDGYYVVRQSNAHAWVEYWQPDEGWVRLDPTAAVSPNRVMRGASLVPRQGLLADALGGVNPQLLADLRNLLEASSNELRFEKMPALLADGGAGAALAQEVVGRVVARTAFQVVRAGGAGQGVVTLGRRVGWRKCCVFELVAQHVVVVAHDPDRAVGRCSHRSHRGEPRTRGRPDRAGLAASPGGGERPARH